MRLVVLCVALSCWAQVAAAQVSVVRRQVEDEQVARALEKLIGEPVLLAAAHGGRQLDPTARVTVSVDRQRGVLRVITANAPGGLVRALDQKLLADSPYAVALAAAELIELSSVTARPASGSEPAQTDVSGEVARSDAAPQRELEIAYPRPSPDPIDRPESPSVSLDRESRDEQPRPTQDGERPTQQPPASSEHQDRAEQGRADDNRLTAEQPDARTRGSSGLPDYAIGADLELQSQPGYQLSFVRPAISGELAWGRDTAGLFWTAGARVCAPLGRELQPLAAGPAEDSRVRAQAMDAALQATLGYAFGRLALTAQLGAGLSYLRVEAWDADRRSLGHDATFSPLLAAGVGARLSIALGFALALRGETQWAGRGTEYRIGGERVLEDGPVRLGILAGIVWESAFGRAGL